MKTYKEFWKELNDEFHFTIDVAADDNNHMCPRYYTPWEDGLKQEWIGETVWCNPPFGDGIRKWMHKAAIEFEKSYRKNIVVMMLPDKTNVSCFEDIPGEQYYETRSIGKLKFEGQYGFNGDLMLLIFRRR